jgi:hypothetical protein
MGKGASMTTTRYFEVKVTGCNSCPKKNIKYDCCDVDFDVGAAYLKYHEIFKQNKDQLTDSCPMWEQSKESETK